MTKKLSRDAVLKRVATAKCQEIPDGGAAGLRLVIQPTGAKSWAMRFRRPNGKAGNLQLGPFDRMDREAVDTPIIGQALIVAEAHALAAEINLQRARGIDVIAQRQAEKQRQGVEAREQSTFPTHARDFIERHARPKTRRWRDTARLLGYVYASEGDAEPVLIEGSLCDRWRARLITEIDGDDIFAAVDEAQHRGLPGLGQKQKASSDSRGRKLASTLGVLFGWLHRHCRIKTNPTIGIHRPVPAKPRDRILNTKPEVRHADELRWFWRACDILAYPYGDLCKLMLLSGCRREELARARWDEFSDDLATLHLPSTRAKNHRAHRVPMSPLARAILAGAPKISAYVFSSNGSVPIAGFSGYKRRLDVLMMAEAVKERGKTATIAAFTLHDLRRSTASGCAAIGIAPHIIEACLNHAGGAKAGVAGTYNVEAYEPEKIAAITRWAAHIEGIVSGSNTANVVSLRQAG